MKQNRYTLFKLFFIYLMLLGDFFYAQNDCDCSIDQMENEFKIQNDSITLFQKIQKYKDSHFIICQYEGVNIEFQYYNNQLQSKKAYSLLQQQEVLFNELDCNNGFLFKLIYNKTRYYHVMNDLENLSHFAFKSLTEAKRLNDAEKQIKSIKELVYLYTRINEDGKNWKYIKEAQQLILDLKQPELYPHYYSWLAFEYENKYTITNRKSLLDSTLLFINKAKKGAYKYHKFDEISKSYRVEEAVAYHKGDLKKALVNIDSAIYYGKKIKGHKNLSGLYLSKAWDHLDLGQFEEANIWMDTTLFYINNKRTAASMMIYSEAALIYEGSSKFDKALKSLKSHNKLKDSILNIDKINKINELEQKYHKVKNEQKIVSLEKTKQLYLFLIIGSLLAVLSLIFFFRQRALKNKQKILETEERLNRARINPHFFFNGMASLQKLSLQEKSSKTTLFISRFAKIMRKSLESTYEELTTVEEEIDFLTQYLEIQKLRYPEKFEYQFHIEDSLEINELKLPGMLMQPFIENAIEHGFKSIDYKGSIDITFIVENNELLVIVEDNGIGLNLPEKEKEHKSRAMQIIKDRLYLFNKQYNSSATYKIDKTKTSKGFKIIVNLPKLY